MSVARVVGAVRAGVACCVVGLLGMGSSAVIAAGVSGQGTWESTLQGRDLDGVLSTIEAYYDTELRITWLADANRAKTTGYDDDGRMAWQDAMDWVSSLSVGGVTGWRLPTMIDSGALGCNLSYAGGTDCGSNVLTKSGSTIYSEMAHLYVKTLGNASFCVAGDALCQARPTVEWGLTNTGGFQNLFSTYYWTGVAYGPASVDYAWFYGTNGGVQYVNSKFDEFYAWAVHPGDIGTPVVPEPGIWALSLLGAALMPLAVRRAQARAHVNWLANRHS